MNIYDIAEAAGVSIATVSRVIGGSDKVSEKTYNKVMEVINNSDYVPNPFARGLGLGTMKLIGILCTDVSDIFYATAVSNLEHLLSGHGLHAMLYCTGDSLEDKRKGLTILLHNKVDAIILIGSAFVEPDRERNSHLLAAAKQRPLFCVNGDIDADNIYCVYCNEKRAMYDNAVSLLDAGCRRIAYFYDSTTPSNLAKLAGLRQALSERLGEVDEGMFVQVEREMDRCIAEAGRLMDTQEVDGILASEDILAIGACKAARDRGRQPPAIGFNNSILARCATPALTSMDNMLESICNIVISQLVDVLDGKETPHSVSLTGRLVQRETFRRD